MPPVNTADARIPAHPSLEAAPSDLENPVPETSAKVIHVTRQGDNWRAGFEGTDASVAVTPTKAEALDHARAIAKERGLDVVVHRKDGTIQKRLSA